MPDLNIFNLDFGNLAKLINKGRVDKVYYKMYKVADSLTREDFKKFQLELLSKSNENSKRTVKVIIKKDNKKRRIVVFERKSLILPLWKKQNSNRNIAKGSVNTISFVNIPVRAEKNDPVKHR